MTSPSPAAACRLPVVLGIDAGGSRTRARAMQDAQVLYEGSAGPGNPLAADEKTLRASYASALAGCPAPAHVAACVAGTGAEEQRTQIAAILKDRFPGCPVLVLPDYVGAVLAAPPGTDVTVIAGTGSLVCTRPAEGTFVSSGGRGWILGDRGSAARIGRAGLEWFCDDPQTVPQEAASAFKRALGTRDWRLIVRDLSSTPNPAATLGRAAPVVTKAAEQGQDWAQRILDAEMTALATLTTRHVERHCPELTCVRIALAGGVWRSKAARSRFAAAMARSHHPGTLAISRSRRDPLDGAVLLAASMAP
jgi:glucosamine kinase